MEYIRFVRDLKLKSDDYVRELIRFGIDVDKVEEKYYINYQIELINEAITRIWDELEGHRDICGKERKEENVERDINAFFDALQTIYKESENKMDKEIRKIEKETKKVGKDLKGLEKADKKRDKIVAVGKKTMKKKGKC